MSIKGRPLTWIEAAIARGDRLSAWAAAHELRRGELGLDHALALVVLASAEGDPDRADRAARRWLARAAVEERSVDLARLAEILEELPDLVAVTLLAGVAEQHRWRQTLVALDHLLPRAGR